MDERIRQGLLLGRRLFREGAVDAALCEWKEALRVAYETQSYAAAFVLSKNVGDATLEARSGYEDAVGYYDYALELLRTCSLDGEYGHHTSLVDAARYIRRRRRRARRLLDSLSNASKAEDESFAREENAPFDRGNELRGDEEVVCTTCEQRGTKANPIIVDEADGCYYCQACFDAFYAQANETIEGTDGGNALVDHSTEPVRERDDLLNPMESPSLLEPHLGDKEQPNDDPETISHPVEEAEVAASTEEDEPDEIEQPTETPETNDAKRVYTIAQLKSLNRADLPCPPDLKESVVSLANASTSTDRGQRTTPKGRLHQKDKNTKRNGSSTKQPTQTPPSASLLPTLAECDALEVSMASQPSPIDLARALFDAVPGAAPIDLQLQIFSETS